MLLAATDVAADLVVCSSSIAGGGSVSCINDRGLDAADDDGNSEEAGGE